MINGSSAWLSAGYLRTISLLLQNGANVNAATESDTNALELALIVSTDELCKLLLRHGAEFSPVRKERLEVVIDVVTGKSRLAKFEERMARL